MKRYHPVELPDVPIDTSFMKILLAVLIVVITYVTATTATFILERLSDRFPARRFFFKRLQPIPQIGGYAVAAFFIVQILSPGRDALIAMLASMGLAIGLAAQDLLKDIIGGIVALFDSSFQVGDRIRVGNFYGEVTKIGLRSTKVVTPDDSQVTIPNSQLLTAGVSNTNAGAVDCLVTAHIYLPPHVDLTTIETIAREAVLTSKAVYLDKPITILLNEELIETRLTHLEIRAYTFDTRYEEMFAADLTRRIKKAFYGSDLIPEDLAPTEDIFNEIRLDKLDERIKRGVAENLIDLGMEFARQTPAAARTNGK